MEKLVQQILDYLSTIPRPKNWVLKLLSLFFALFLWYFVAGEDKVDMNVSIPVEIVNLPHELVISNQFKKQLDVTVSGQRSLIKSLANQGISRTIDLSKAKPGKEVINNEPDSIPFPWGISVLRLQPSSITLLIDRMAQKSLDIKPTIKGRPAEGYKLTSITLEPSKIEISGPLGILDEEEYLNTKIIDISGQKSSFLKQVTLDIKPILAELIGEPVVSAQVNIVEKTAARVITEIPVEIVNADNRNFRLTPNVIDLKVEIPVNITKETQDLKTLFKATVDPTGLGTGKTELEVNITTPYDTSESEGGGLHILSVSPPTVNLGIVGRNKRKVQ